MSAPVRSEQNESNRTTCEVCRNTIPDDAAACVFHEEGCAFDGGFADQCCCEGFVHRRCCRTCREPIRAVWNARAV